MNIHSPRHTQPETCTAWRPTPPHEYSLTARVTGWDVTCLLSTPFTTSYSARDLYSLHTNTTSWIFTHYTSDRMRCHVFTEHGANHVILSQRLVQPGHQHHLMNIHSIHEWQDEMSRVYLARHSPRHTQPETCTACTQTPPHEYSFTTSYSARDLYSVDTNTTSWIFSVILLCKAKKLSNHWQHCTHCCSWHTGTYA